MSEPYRKLFLVLGAALLVVGIAYGLLRGCGDRRQVIHVATADALPSSTGVTRLTTICPTSGCLTR
jgi:hypothetical protein